VGRVPGLSGVVAFGCAIEQVRRQHAAVVAAGRSESGKILVDLAPFYGHPSQVVARVAELYSKHDPVCVVVDGRSDSSTLIPALAQLGIVVLQPSPADVACAHGEFLDLVNDQGLEHLGQPPLTEAVRHSVERALAGGQAWERKLAVDQSPLDAATLAAWGFRRWEELSQPGVFTF
jgi:hypothetical protein